MSKHEIVTQGQLVYGGVEIREKGEMLSLTDMWKAEGSDPQQAPAKWRSLPSTQTFIDHVSDIVGKSDIIKSGRGRNGSTFAHWQIGLAYAKYLSPDFHMWCNDVVRAHMEGAPIATHDGLSKSDLAIIGNIVKNCAGVVVRDQIANLLPMLIEPLIAARLAEKNMLIRRGKTAKQIWDAAGMPPKIKGVTIWFGNRLAEMGCSSGRADRGDSAIRLFDPDKAEICLRNGLSHKAKVYSSERMGQGRLKLIGGAK